MKTIDVGQVLDEGRWTGYQKLLIVGTALTIILDGIDNQLLPNTIPALIADWGGTRGNYVPALAWGPFGMMIGGLIGGVLGDRLGRRTALLASVITFAVLTFAIAYVPAGRVDLLGLLRFLAGVGLGGAMPNAATLASEYVPRKQRPFAVTMTIICIPLGGVVAAEMAALIIPDYGWRALFQAGGVLPLVLAAILWRVLPESPRYLAARKERWPELTQALRKMGHDVPDDAVYADTARSAAPTRSGNTIYYVLVVAGLMALWQLGYVAGPLLYGAVAVALILLAVAIREFSPAYRRDTAGLFGSFFFCLMVNYVIIQLLVVFLTENGGFTAPQANRALSISNVGGVVGALVGALLIQQFGSRITMLGMSAIAIGSALILASRPLDPSDMVVFLILVGVTGALLNAVQTTMYALATNVYPTEIRGTGVGTAVAVGRIGNVLAAFVGNYAIDVGQVPGYWLSIAILMGLVLASLAIIQRHVPRTSLAGVPVAAPASR
jgi:AAHS family 4-hydroxybenzoate transporter-like MFS transporter